MTAPAALRGLAWLMAASLPVGCAAPPLTLYTLGGPMGATDTFPPRAPLGTKPTVIEIARVSVPDELDTEDIVVRDGSMLRRSTKGRWASRLSLGATDRLTARLAARLPDVLVTDRPQAEPASYRVLLDISRLDVTTSGTAMLAANWLVVPHDPRRPAWRNRTRFKTTGPVATDQDVVTLGSVLLDHLADVIDVSTAVDVAPPGNASKKRRPERLGRAHPVRRAAG